MIFSAYDQDVISVLFFTDKKKSAGYNRMTALN